MMFAFCSRSRPASKLMWPPLLESEASSVMSLLAPMALTSRLPAAVTVPVGSVAIDPARLTKASGPPETRSDCAASLVAVVLASASTRFTATAAVCPTVRSIASVRNSPPAPAAPLRRVASSSNAFVASPMPMADALSRNSLAYKSTLFATASIALSTIDPAMLNTLTAPQSAWPVIAPALRSAAVRASTTPSVMSPDAW